MEMKYGGGLNVAMGGGRANFLPDSVSDPEHPGRAPKGWPRSDARRLQRYGERATSRSGIRRSSTKSNRVGRSSAGPVRAVAL
ncbi:hypothetical protein M8494_27870 [Serratia ureilytica]